MVRQECVSTGARAAIGYETAVLEVKEGDPTDFVLFGKKHVGNIDSIRRWKTIQEVVCDAGIERLTIRFGAVVSRRRC